MATKKRHNASTVLTVVSINGEPNVLMLLRSPKTPINPLKWGSPAGHIEHGELPVTAAGRELTEETGIVANELFPMGEEKLSDEKNDYDLHLFITFVKGDGLPKVHLRPREHLAFSFFPWKWITENLDVLTDLNFNPLTVEAFRRRWKDYDKKIKLNL